MARHKQHAFYEAVREAAAAVNSGEALKPVIDTIIRSTARAMGSAASLVLLDSTGRKLAHKSSWGLPDAYLRKGLLDADRSIAEVASGRPVAILDVAHDSRVQFPDLAARAGIASILGVPLMLGGEAAGAVRVYTKTPASFTQEDIDFVTVMANLTGLALLRSEHGEKAENGGARAAVLRKISVASFANASEAEFARILDFYSIEWVYEPRSFALAREGDTITEMFTPDFYLPALDLYVELTTLKQSLVTQKNRKLRRLELYPEIKITLLYKKDFDRLLAKYGCGSLAQERGHGIERVLFSSAEIEQRVREMAGAISRDYAGRRPVMVGVLRGVFCFMADLVRQMSIPLDIDFIAISYYTGGDATAVKITKDMDLNVSGRPVIMVEDIVDTGMTLSYMLNHIQSRGPAGLAVCALLDKRARRLVNVPLDYIGFTVPDEFVVGYGLDYREEYRNLPFISVLKRVEKEPGGDSTEGAGK